MNSMAKYQELKKQMKSFKKNLELVVKDAFHECMKSLFEQNPLLNKFSFNCYTPYFNDGDECLYSAHIDYPQIIESKPNGIEEELDIYDIEEDDPLYGIPTKITNALIEFSDDDYKAMFGDHVKVIVDRDGIKTDYYEHD